MLMVGRLSTGSFRAFVVSLLAAAAIWSAGAYAANEQVTLHLKALGKDSKSFPTERPPLPIPPGELEITLPVYPGALSLAPEYNCGSCAVHGSPYEKCDIVVYQVPTNPESVLNWYQKALTDAGFEERGGRGSGSHSEDGHAVNEIYRQFTSNKLGDKDLEVWLSARSDGENRSIVRCLADAIDTPQRPADSFLPDDIKSVKITRFYDLRTGPNEPIDASDDRYRQAKIITDPRQISVLVASFNGLPVESRGLHGGDEMTHHWELVFSQENGTKIECRYFPSHAAVVLKNTALSGSADIERILADMTKWRVNDPPPLTTLKEDLQEAQASEAQHDFAEAERCYRHALEKFPDAQTYSQGSAMAPMRVMASGPGSIGFGSRSSITTCNCAGADKCAEILNDLLRVLYQQNKFNTAVTVSKAFVTYIQRTASGPDDPNLVTAKANYKELIERAETHKRWPTFAPFFRQHKFVGMDRTQVHEILGKPVIARHMDSSVRGVHIIPGGDYPSDDMPNPGHRDFYILSVLMPDPPPVGSADLHQDWRPPGDDEVYLVHEGQNGVVFALLDIDYVDDRVVRYRLRTRDHVGDWASDNNAPSWPNQEPL